MNDIDYIKQFKEISVKNVCSDLHLLKDYHNIMSGRASKKKINKVRNELERRLNVFNAKFE